MSRFLILSLSGDGVGLAMRLKAEGHSAKLWIRESEYEDSGKGLVDCARDYEYGQDVIADCTGFGSLCDLLRDKEVSVFSGSSFADSLEEDRELSQTIMSDSGIDTPKSAEATSWDQAAKLVDKIAKLSDEGKVVIKPEGSSSGSIPSYVASDPEDAISFLESFAKKHDGEPELTIQQFIKGVAVSTEGWFNGEDFIAGMYNHTLEKKASLNDDLGPSIGCAGNVVWSCEADDPIVKETLQKLTVTLRKHHYVGPIDINTVVNEKGVYGLEFTPRFGYDAFPTLLYTLVDFDFGSFIYRCSRGMDVSEAVLNQGFGAGIRLRPPRSGKLEELSEIRGLTEEDRRWFYPYCCQLTENDVLKMTKGESGPGVMNGHGDTIGEAFARAYEACSRLQCRDIQYRSDLSDSLLADFRELRSILSGDDGSWLGCDLDGTLASYSGWSEEIGEPVPKMIQRVKQWLDNGKEVRILTARGSVGDNKYVQLIKVYDWVKQHIGTPLEVTSKKDPLMTKLYDDRVQKVEANSGVFV